jgi:hypothetical protein
MTQLETASFARGDRRKRARAGDCNFRALRMMRAARALNSEVVKTNPIVPSFTRGSGALRVCAIWRAARARTKNRRMQIFSRTLFGRSR